MWPRGSNLALRENLEGWDGVRGGKEFQEAGDICVLVAESHGSMTETSTATESDYTLIKNKIKKRKDITLPLRNSQSGREIHIK